MKKKLLPIALLSLFGILLAGCASGSKKDNTKPEPEPEPGPVEPVNVPVTGVTLDHTTLSVVKGNTATLTPTIAPATATNKEVTWSSDDEDVVLVSKTGVVTAVEVGEATVTVKTKDGNFTASCVVTVVKEIESVAISNKSAFANFTVDDYESLSITIVPEDNPTALLAAGALKVTSSDETVASVNGLIVTALKTGSATITVTLFGKTDTLPLTIGEAIPGVPKSVKQALDIGIEEAPWNGQTGNKAEMSETCFELKGKIMAVAPNGDTGYNAILDDGTAAVYLQVSKLATEAIPVQVGDFAKVTCKFTNYYGLLEGVSRKAATGDNANWIPAKDVEVIDALDITPTLATAEDMTADQYNAYYDVCVINATKDHESATYTEMKRVNIVGTYREAFVEADKGKYQISDKYGLAPIGSFKLDEPFEGQVSTLEAFLLGANTGKGKSNAIVVGQTPLAPTSVAIEQQGKVIVKNNQFQLTITTLPAGSYARQGTWTSTDETVATVDENGLVTGVYSGEGSAKATIKVVLSEGVEATTEIEVYGQEIPATSVELDAATLTLYLGRAPETLHATVLPELNSDTAVWSSSDETVATVDQKGVVTAVKVGTANITVTLNETVSATCAVTVAADPWWNTEIETTDVADIEIPSSGDTADDYTVIAKIVDIYQATYGNAHAVDAKGTAFIIYGMYSRNGNVRYDKLENKPVAGDIVVVQGKFTLYKNDIEVKNARILQHNGVVTTIPDLASISLSVNELELAIGEESTLSTTFAPADANTPAISWKSSDEGVATVAAGKVTAIGGGSATITAFVDADADGEIDEGEVKDECAVTVAAPTVELELFATAKFGSAATSCEEANSYTSSWSSTYNGFKVDVVNGNNYTNGWDHVRFGSKNAAAVGSVTTNAKIAGQVGKVVVNFTGVDADNTNSIKLYTSADGSAWTEAGTFTVATGEQKVQLQTPTANLFYKVEFDLKKGSGNGFIKVSAIEFYVVKGEEQAAALPVGNFSGTIVVNGTDMYTVVAVCDTLAYVEIGDSFKVQKAYAFNSETKVLTVELGGNFGNLTATHDAEEGSLKNVGIDGAYAAAVTDNNAITLNGALHLFDCEGTAEDLQAIFKRREGGSEAGKVALDSEHVAAGEGAVQLPGRTTGDVRLNLRNDLTPTAAKNLGFWVYNPSESNVKIRAWIYKGANLSNNASVLSDSGLEIAPGWTYVRCFGFNATIYNIQIGDFTSSGVNLTFDNIAIY